MKKTFKARGQTFDALWGMPGKGKSAILKKTAKKVAKKRRHKVIDFKTPKSWKAIDFRGIPDVGFYDEQPQASWEQQMRAYRMLTDQIASPFEVRACTDDRGFEKAERKRMLDAQQKLADELAAKRKAEDEERKVWIAEVEEKNRKWRQTNVQVSVMELEDYIQRKALRPEEQVAIWRFLLDKNKDLYASDEFADFARRNLHLFVL